MRGQGRKAVSPPGIEPCVPTGPAGQAVGIPIVAGEYLAIWTQKDATGGSSPAFTTSILRSEYTRIFGDLLGVQQATSALGGFLLLLETSSSSPAQASRR